MSFAHTSSNRPVLALILGAIFFITGLPAGGDEIVQTPAPGTIVTVAGNGRAGYGITAAIEEDIAATSASLYLPYGVWVANDGSIYIGDHYNHAVRRVRPDGMIERFAGLGIGTGFAAPPMPAAAIGDHGPATNALLDAPAGVEMDQAGNLYIADSRHHRIRRVDVDGMITTIAGTGEEGFGGDGGLAYNAKLAYPTNVAFDAQDNMYVADQYNLRVRRVDGRGIITTVAGTGTYYGYGGDGGPATTAQMAYPNDIALDPSGNLYIADRTNHRIRWVNTSGIITTIAGNGTRGFAGDGGAAIHASLNFVTGIVLDGQGNLFIVDAYNNRIRMVNRQGIISTVAGNGEIGFSGDNGPATDASLNQPRGVALDSSGNLYIADTGNQRVRKVIGPLG